MKIKHTPKFLEKVEKIFNHAGYLVRYEKGNFKSGYCILNSKKVVVVNKYYTVEGKVNCLIDILGQVNWDFSALEEEDAKIYQGIMEHHSKNA